MLSRFEKFIYYITESDLYWHRIASAVMSEFNLKGNCAVYFILLHTDPEGLTSSQFAARSGRDKADVSRDIAILEQGGFVRRVLNDGSAYRARIVLTDAGRAITEKVIRKTEQAVECVGGELSDEERAVFYRALSVITDNLQRVSANGLAPEEGES